MYQQIIISALILAIVLPIGAFYIGEKKVKKFKVSLAINIVSFFSVLVFATIFTFSGVAMAETAGAVGAATSDVAGFAQGMGFLGAALSTGLGSIGAGVATGSAASAALGALSENDSIMGKALIFVALAEGIAIYGLIIAFMILNKI